MLTLQQRAVWALTATTLVSAAALFLVYTLSPTHFLRLGSGTCGLIFAAMVSYIVIIFPFTVRQRLLRLAIILNPICALTAASISLVLWDYDGFLLPMLLIGVAVVSLLASFALLLTHLHTLARRVERN